MKEDTSTHSIASPSITLVVQPACSNVQNYLLLLFIQ